LCCSATPPASRWPGGGATAGCRCRGPDRADGADRAAAAGDVPRPEPRRPHRARRDPACSGPGCWR
jgi:hypothetical protein